MTPSALTQLPSGQLTGQVTLAGLRDRARVLLFFAASSADTSLAAQLRILNAHTAELRDRDLVPLALPYRVAAGPASTAAQLSHAEAEVVRRRFHVAPGDFLVVLLGKDGNAKLRSRTPVPIAQLNQTIDSMPMRQGEMRERKP